MRKISVSGSYLSALQEQLAFGELRFGPTVVEEKRRRVSTVIREVLAVYPAVGAFCETLGIFHYPVSGTPFEAYAVVPGDSHSGFSGRFDDH